jgi:tRNA dimethylallyltransferase
VRALSEGLFVEPPLDGWRRQALERWTAELPPHELVRWAARLDPGFKGGGRQRATRAVELALLTGRSLSYWQRIARQQATVRPWYVRLTVPRQVLHQRIRRRALQMVQQGIIEEVAAALADGAEAGSPGLDGVGLKEAAAYLLQGGDRAQVAEAIIISSRQYAKRQETWFRHQLPTDAIVLDATRPPDELAAEIAARWRHHSDQKAASVP